MLVVILMLSITATLVTIPSATPQTTQYTKKVYPFCGASPNPVGVGQLITLHIGITDQVNWESLWWSWMERHNSDSNNA